MVYGKHKGERLRGIMDDEPEIDVNNGQDKPLELSPHERTVYGQQADELTHLIIEQLPQGGIVALDGTPGIGKNTFIEDFLFDRVQGSGHRLVHLDLDGFAECRELRQAMVRALVENGEPVTDEFHRIYRVAEANQMLIPVLEFVGSRGDPEEERHFLLPGPFRHGGGAEPPRFLVLRRRDLVVLNAEYVHRFEAVRTGAAPSINVRLIGSADRVRAQWTARARAAYAHDPDYLKFRLRYHQLVTLPSVAQYEAETRHLVNVCLSFNDTLPPNAETPSL